MQTYPPPPTKLLVGMLLVMFAITGCNRKSRSQDKIIEQYLKEAERLIDNSSDENLKELLMDFLDGTPSFRDESFTKEGTEEVDKEKFKQKIKEFPEIFYSGLLKELEDGIKKMEDEIKIRKNQPKKQLGILRRKIEIEVAKKILSSS